MGRRNEKNGDGRKQTDGLKDRETMATNRKAPANRIPSSALLVLYIRNRQKHMGELRAQAVSRGAGLGGRKRSGPILE